MTITALQTIEDAAQKIRVKRAGFALPAEDAQFGLRELNRMLSHWFGANNLMIPWRTHEELALPAGQNNYTIGTGGDINTAVPESIWLMKLKINSDEYPLTPRSIEIIERHHRTANVARPDYYHFLPGDTLGTLFFDCTVDQAYTLILWSLKPLTGFASLTASDALPEEYEELIVNNLAVRWAANYGKEASQTTKEMAKATFDAICDKNLAARLATSTVDPALLSRRRFDFYSDDY